MTLKRKDFDFLLTENNLNKGLCFLNIDIGYHDVVFIFPLFEPGTMLKCTEKSFHSFIFLSEMEKESISDKETQRAFVNVFNRNKNSKMRIFGMSVNDKNIVYLHFEMKGS